jgi:hypothetical protein
MERFYDAGGNAEDDAWRVYDRKRKATAKQRVLEHYGMTCACCGTIESLTIDHINGDGKRHRQEIGENSHAIYRWLIKNNFPAGFQTLCGPCNNSKRNSASCRLLHIPTCPTCHRPFTEEEAVDSRGRRVWAQAGTDTDAADLQESA